MLGHKNIRTTQHYAKLLDVKVAQDMQLHKTRLSQDELQKKELLKIV